MSPFTDSDRMFFSDGYRLTEEFLGRDVSEQHLSELIENMYDLVDGLIGSFMDRCRKESLPVDCRKGCSWCCHQAIMASPYELIYLVQWIRRHFPEDRQQKVIARTFEKARQTIGLKASEFMLFKASCPLLEEGSCSVYPARPLACKIYLSSSLESCIREFKDPGDQLRFPSLYAFPLRAGRMINEGNSAWLLEKGFQVDDWLLEQMLYQLFARQEILLSWFNGRTAFSKPDLDAEDRRFLERFSEI
ncbi:MAG TPA: hypothetical protein ENF21_09620 [Bacteroidetes bacterium]|nr:hypothetical protein [Bacteroidota bacterium]